MREFVPPQAKGGKHLRIRVNAILDELKEAGYYDNSYREDFTYTARETFEKKRGNCLAFTSLFVALARSAGLDARFQRVRGSVAFGAVNGILENQQHINVIVNDRDPSRQGRKIVVDFNEARPIGHPTEVISDRAATALFLNNFGIEYLTNGEYSKSFPYIRAAIQLDPLNSSLWVNLGTLYLALNETQKAEWVNLYAYQLDPKNTSALAGLHIVFTRSGEHQKAGQVERHLRQIRNRNPYFHFALAQKAFANLDYNTTLKLLRRVLKLEEEDPQVFALKAETHLRLGQRHEAIRNFKQAWLYASDGSRKSFYLNRMRDLTHRLEAQQNTS